MQGLWGALACKGYTLLRTHVKPEFESSINTDIFGFVALTFLAEDNLGFDSDDRVMEA